MGAAVTEIIARAVIRRDGHLLLATQRAKSWSFLPGGHVEPGEPVESALIREIKEELGTEATIVKFLGVVEHGYIEDGIAHHELNFVLEVDIADSEPTSQETHLEFRWCPIDDFAESDVRPRTLRDAVLATADKHTQSWHGWNC